MVVDASALIAILMQEHDGPRFQHALVRAPVRLMSPVNWFEAAMIGERFGNVGFDALEAFVARAGIMIVPVAENHMRAAHQAFRKFGKGRGPAKLNLGDCFAYALAKISNEPLLFKGKDFIHTDIVPAL